MPRTTTVTRGIILDSAFEIVRMEGFQNLTARNIAKKIGCSTQPIYWIYENMEDLRQDVIQKMVKCLKGKMSSYRKTGKPFLDFGLGYIYVAHTEPILFRAVYVENILNVKMNGVVPNKSLVDVMRRDNQAKGMSEKTLKKIAIDSWIYVHGVASLVSSGLMAYEERKIERLLLSFVMVDDVKN
ncbi:MAG: TetR/AcrR family transcriptional regulator [Prevotellaceae bacterium]|jgi:AcrR family transcriptional regulator|nr:TetR/AcrR family transcriptional regulator [Prevotellaceae bacterium]